MPRKIDDESHGERVGARISRRSAIDRFTGEAESGESEPEHEKVQHFSKRKIALPPSSSLYLRKGKNPISEARKKKLEPK